MVAIDCDAPQIVLIRMGNRWELHVGGNGGEYLPLLFSLIEDEMINVIIVGNFTFCWVIVVNNEKHTFNECGLVTNLNNFWKRGMIWLHNK